MTSLASPTLPSLMSTFGALFIGATIAAVLFGIMNLQISNDWSLYLYSRLFWVLDSIHFALGTHALYYYLIDMYGNFLGALVENAIWSMRVRFYLEIQLCNSKYILPCSGSFNLFSVGRHFHKLLPWFVFIAMAMSLVMSYETCIPQNLVTVSTIRISIYIFYSVAITTDLIIALMMCYYLHESRAVIHLPSTAHKLLGLMQLALVSGLATSIYLAWSDTLIFVAIDFILPKLYINSLLAMCIVFLCPFT
ncbi:hypothetical protein EDD18DRAFT_1200978 [Armillaria luteobubalina]|uniref:DUF6534 domain-containing protein n=1 Tax=Armillaria luteobubalina TaxID=153913 RepID=A0AA39UHK8_9AGAR|nr:hypothetical protein EDD18DRAFT_1200978 [Armillaria luteobubalina]